MATPRLSTKYLCLLTNNLLDHRNFPDISPFCPTGFWFPSFEGMTMCRDSHKASSWGDVL